MSSIFDIPILCTINTHSDAKGATKKERMTKRFAYHKLLDQVHWVDASTTDPIDYFVKQLPESISQVIIVQDDILLRNNFRQCFPLYYQHIPIDAPIVLLSYVASIQQFIDGTIKPSSGNVHLTQSDKVSGKQMYLIRRDYALDLHQSKERSEVRVVLPLLGIEESALDQTNPVDDKSKSFAAWGIKYFNAAEQAQVEIEQPIVEQVNKQVDQKVIEPKDSDDSKEHKSAHPKVDKPVEPVESKDDNKKEDKKQLDGPQLPTGQVNNTKPAGKKNKKKNKHNNNISSILGEPIAEIKQASVEQLGKTAAFFVTDELNAFRPLKYIGPNGPNGNKTMIVLCMIVKNESRIMERCLNSALGVADAIAISDTGSTDNTIEVIHKWQRQHRVPGVVFLDKFINFAYNRSLSIINARKLIDSLGFNMSSTYLLFLDADMILTHRDDPTQFDKTKLDKDCYMLRQIAWNLDYKNIRFLRMNHKWKCVGVTHEYYTPVEQINHTSEDMEVLFIDDRYDGGCKADKFERDVRLLTQGLKDEPMNERYMFYLAQTYKDVGQYVQAIPLYLDRIKRGGFGEEVWFSKYMLAHCYEQLHEKELQEIEDAKKEWEQKNPQKPYPKAVEPKLYTRPKVVDAYLEAFHMRPHRAEPLERLAGYYRRHDHPSLCCMTAQHGAGLAYPANDQLFIDPTVYNHLLIEHIAICGFHCPDLTSQTRGKILCDRLVMRSRAPIHVRQHCLTVLWWYIKALPEIEIKANPLTEVLAKAGALKPGYPFPALHPIIPQELKDCSWYLKNASIVSSCSLSDGQPGYCMLISLVNYQITETGGYVGYGNWYVYSRNILAYFDTTLTSVVEWHELQDLTKRQLHSYLIQGIEDPRLISGQTIDQRSDSPIYFTCTTLDTNGMRVPEMCLGTLTSTAQLIDLHPLVEEGVNRVQECQKNWLPFSYEQMLLDDESEDEQKKQSCEQSIQQDDQPIKQNEQTAQESSEPNSNSNKKPLPIWMLRCGEPMKILRCDSPIKQPVIREEGGYKIYECPVELEAEVRDGVSVSEFRGSMPPVPFHDGWLFLEHEVAQVNGRRKYMHRFVYTNLDFEPLMCSFAFCFQDRNKIEYVAGGCWSHDKTHLILCLSVEDNESFLVHVPVNSIKKSLMSIQLVPTNTTF